MATDTAEHSEIAADQAAMEGLKDPFPENLVKSRSGRGNQTFRYIERETAEERFDDVLGASRWECDEWIVPNAVNPKIPIVKCTIKVHLPSGRVLARSGIGELDPTNRCEFPHKATSADAFKRAASMFGVARYLWSEGTVPDEYDRPEGYRPPEVRNAARNGPTPGARPPARRDDRGTSGGNGSGSDDTPRSGKAFFAWMKNQEKSNKAAEGVVDHIQERCSAGVRIVDLDPEDVRLAYKEAISYIAAYSEGGTADDEEIPY